MSKYRTMVLSFLFMLAFWSFLFGSLSLAGTFIVLLAVHEFGHYIVAQKLGMRVSLPVFTPLGALINMREMPRNAFDEAKMAYGGPFLGTVGSLVAFGIGHALGWHTVVLAAKYGFLLNLFNLVPLSPLDGGRISMAIDRRLWVLGALAFGGYMLVQLLAGIFNPFNLLIFAIIGCSAYIDHKMRTKQAIDQPEYFSVSPVHRLAFADAYLGLIAFLLCMLLVVA